MYLGPRTLVASVSYVSCICVSLCLVHLVTRYLVSIEKGKGGRKRMKGRARMHTKSDVAEVQD